MARGRTETATRKKVGRPPGAPAKIRGSVRTRRTLRRIAKSILDETADDTVQAGADRLGLVYHDIKNLRAGNLPGLQLLLRLVAKGHYCPDALIRDGRIKKLSARVSTRAARQNSVTKRVRNHAHDSDAASLAKATGLSIYSIYQLRVGNRPAGIHTILAFIDAGIPTHEIFFGRMK
jgi:hypothetical protein